MNMKLLAIKFNHDPLSANSATVNLRRNAQDFVTVPEWQQGVSFNIDDSVAAYTLDNIQDSNLTIQAKFARTGSPIPKLNIRAIQPPIPEPALLLPLNSWYAGYAWYILYLWQLLLQTQVNVLGEVKAKQVTFRSNGQTAFETFELRNHRLLESGVGIHPVIWHWQYQVDPWQPWIDIATTVHKVYTVLQTPTRPWVQTPYQITNTQLPWTEVLDHACRWAVQTRTLDDAATAITRSVYYGLGRNRSQAGYLNYDCPIGQNHYTIDILNNGYFNCTQFLERLLGNFGMGPRVNCTDCACIVSTFANILGCDLWQSQMHPDLFSFLVNPIRTIGDLQWDVPCSIGSFSYHEVAWKNNCSVNDAVYDACLEVDATTPPLWPYTPLLPANLRFGRAGDGQYRDLLAAPPHQNRQICKAQPHTRTRRSVI